MEYNDFVIGSLEHVATIRRLAMLDCESNGKIFHEDDYKWVLGIEVIYHLMEQSTYMITKSIDTQATLFGITVEPDFRNIANVQLWKNITNDI